MLWGYCCINKIIKNSPQGSTASTSRKNTLCRSFQCKQQRQTRRNNKEGLLSHFGGGQLKIGHMELCKDTENTRGSKRKLAKLPPKCLLLRICLLPRFFMGSQPNDTALNWCKKTQKLHKGECLLGQGADNRETVKCRLSDIKDPGNKRGEEKNGFHFYCSN